MVTTNNKKLYERIKLLRSHSMSKDTEQSQKEGWYYAIEHLGYNYRISEINAALGVSQLQRAANNLEKRRAIAKIYDHSLSDTNLKLPLVDTMSSHAYHLYIIQSPDRHSLYNALKAKGIYTQVHYIPLHLQPYYKNFDGSQNLHYTEIYYDSCLSIPMYPTLLKEEQEYVIRAIKDSSK